MKKIIDKLKKIMKGDTLPKIEDFGMISSSEKASLPVSSVSGWTTMASTSPVTYTTTASSYPASAIFAGGIAAAPGGYATGSWIGAGHGVGSSSSFSFTPPTNPYIVSLSNNVTEIVRLNNDGTVTWKDDKIDIDEAAEAFGRSISIGAEIAVGLTEGVKRRMRDSVFEDLINIAKEKGALSAEELTYLLSASKIVEKLKSKRGEE